MLKCWENEPNQRLTFPEIGIKLDNIRILYNQEDLPSNTNSQTVTSGENHYDSASTSLYHLK
jgi:hypothetical protein